MAARKTPSRKRATGPPQPGRRGRAASRSPARGTESKLAVLTERLDMMLPELIARVAAVEHLLVEKGICSHDDLVRSRRFIDEQESW